MAKFVQPNIIFDSSVSFLKNVTFDSSVYLQGVAHINAPSAVSSGTPYALVLETGTGDDLQVKSKLLGTMAAETAATWDSSLSVIRTDINNLETSVGGLDTLTQKHDVSIGVLTSRVNVHESSLGFLINYQGIQDSSIQKVWERWLDSNRTGFVDNTETTLEFTPGSGTFTLNSVGATWSYYRDGIKYTISGDKSVDLPGGASAAAGRYYITIDSTDGSLNVSTTAWDLDTQVVLVAYVDWDSTNSPNYLIGEERHTMLIDRQMHKYLHETRGTQFVTGGVITGPDVSAGVTSVTNANNTFGMSATEIADEDLFQTLPSLTRPNGGTPTYLSFIRASGNLNDWGLEDVPFPVAGGNLQYDDGTNMVAATLGKFVNSYVMFTNLSSSSGAPRYAILPGQGQYDGLEAAIDENPASFDFTGLPVAEYVIAYQLTWEVSSGYSTNGKAALASVPKRISVNSTTASAISTESHNDLIGLQGGNATERYHLSAAQFADYAGKAYVDGSIAALKSYTDASLGARDTRLSGHDTSIAYLNNQRAQLDASIVRIDAYQAIQDASIVAVGGAWKPYVDGSLASRDTSIAYLNAQRAQLDASIGRLDLEQDVQDASIVALRTRVNNHDTSISGLDTLTQTHTTDINNLESSVGALDTLTQTHTSNIARIDASIIRIDAYQAIQDASIAASGLSVKAWNGLTRTDNSIGLGGSLIGDTQISFTNYQLGLLGSVNITGNLIVDGSLTYVNTSQLNVSDNIIEINTGLTGVPPLNMHSGIRVNRGSDAPYFFLFSEATDTFRIGINASEGGLPAGTQAVATREDAPIAASLPFWNSTANRFDTNSGLTFAAATGLDVDNRITANLLTLQNVPNLLTETTALVIATDGSVGYRELGSNAFNSDAYALQTYVDGSLAARDTSISYLNTQRAQLDASIVRIDAYQAIQDASIVSVSTAWKPYVDGSLAARDTSISYLNTQRAQLDASIVRIDASLNDTIDALDLFYSKTYIDGSLVSRDNEISQLDASIVRIDAYQAIQDASIVSVSTAWKPYVDGSLAARDTSIAWLNANKLSLSGGTMSGLLTLSGSGFNLDSTTITEIAVSGGALPDNNTTIATTKLIAESIEAAIGSRIKAVNGLTEYGDGSLGLGGILYQDTTIDTSTHSLEIGPDSTHFIKIDGIGIESKFGSSRVYVTPTQLDITSDGTITLTSTPSMGVSSGMAFSEGGGSLSFKTGFTITDSSDNKQGLVYAGDYSSTFTDRSLVDKAYVDGQAGSSNSAWNGLSESADGSIGLGGTLRAATTIDISTHSLTLANLVSGTTRLAVISDAGVLKTQQLGTMALETATDYVLRTLFDASVAALTTRVNNHDSSLLSLNGLIQTNITDINNLETSVGALDVLTQRHEASIGFLRAYDIIQDSSIAAALAGTTNAWNGLTRTDNSIGLGGTLNQAETTITTNGATNSLRIAGLATSTDDTPFAIVSDTVGGDLKVRELGSMAWAATTAYVPVTGGTFSGPVTFDSSAIFNGKAIFKGNAYFDGSAYFTDVETIDVSSGYIHLNTGLTGAPPANLQSGIIVGRGNSDPYAFVYDETTQTFRIGITQFTGGQYADSSTQAVATREDNPTDFGLPYWNETSDRFDTAAGLTYNSGALNLDGSLSVDGLFLGTGLGTSATEVTALFILPTTGEVVTRELGSNAFNSDSYALQTYVDGSLAARDTSIAYLNANKLDAVANIAVAGDASLFAYEANNIAYLKKIVAGAGATITQDSSTITIAVSGVAGYVSKYTNTFDGTSGTSFAITESTHGLGSGPLNVAVYDGTEQVYTGVDCAANGDITLTWTSGSLSASCKYIITG
jgi:hypothetical protein